MKYFFELLESFSKLKKRKLKILTERDNSNSSQEPPKEVIEAAQQEAQLAINAVKNAIETQPVAQPETQPGAQPGAQPVEVNYIYTQRNPLEYIAKNRNTIQLYMGKKKEVVYHKVGNASFEAIPTEEKFYSRFLPKNVEKPKTPKTPETPETPKPPKPPKTPQAPIIPLTEMELIMQEFPALTQEKREEIEENLEGARAHVYTYKDGQKTIPGSATGFLNFMIKINEISKSGGLVEEINEVLRDTYLKYRPEEPEPTYFTATDLMNFTREEIRDKFNSLNNRNVLVGVKWKDDQLAKIKKILGSLDKIKNTEDKDTSKKISFFNYLFGEVGKGETKSLMGRAISGLQLVRSHEGTDLFEKLSIEKISNEGIVEFSKVLSTLGSILAPAPGSDGKLEFDKELVKKNINENADYFSRTFSFNSDGTIGINLAGSYYVLNEEWNSSHLQDILRFINDQIESESKIEKKDITDQLSAGLIGSVRGVMLEELVVVANRKNILKKLDEEEKEYFNLKINIEAKRKALELEIEAKRKALEPEEVGKRKANLKLLDEEEKKLESSRAAWIQKKKFADKNYAAIVNNEKFKLRLKRLAAMQEKWVQSMNEGIMESELHALGKAANDLLSDEARLLLRVVETINDTFIGKADFILHSGEKTGVGRKTDVTLISIAKDQSDVKEGYAKPMKASELKEYYPEIEQFIENGFIKDDDYLHIDNISYKHYLARGSRTAFTGGNSVAAPIAATHSYEEGSDLIGGEGFHPSLRQRYIATLQEAHIKDHPTYPRAEEYQKYEEYEKSLAEYYEKQKEENTATINEINEITSKLAALTNVNELFKIVNESTGVNAKEIPGMKSVIAKLKTKGLKGEDRRIAQEELKTKLIDLIPSIMMDKLLNPPKKSHDKTPEEIKAERQAERQGKNMVISHLYACGYSVDHGIKSANRVLHEDKVVSYDFSQNSIIEDFAAAVRGETGEPPIKFVHKSTGNFKFFGPDGKVYGGLKFHPGEKVWKVEYNENYLRAREKAGRGVKITEYAGKSPRGKALPNNTQVESTLISTLITTQTKLLETLLNLQKHRVTNFK